MPPSYCHFNGNMMINPPDLGVSHVQFESLWQTSVVSARHPEVDTQQEFERKHDLVDIGWWFPVFSSFNPDRPDRDEDPLAGVRLEDKDLTPICYATMIRKAFNIIKKFPDTPAMPGWKSPYFRLHKGRENCHAFPCQSHAWGCFRGSKPCLV